MSSTMTHAASAAWIAVTAAHVQHNETPYILAAVIAASALDLDHLIYLIKDRAMYQQLGGYQGNLHHARSIFHELLGLLLVGFLAGLLFWVEPKLAQVIFIAFALHVAQD